MLRDELESPRYFVAGPIRLDADARHPAHRRLIQPSKPDDQAAAVAKDKAWRLLCLPLQQ